MSSELSSACLLSPKCVILREKPSISCSFASVGRLQVPKKPMSSLIIKLSQVPGSRNAPLQGMGAASQPPQRLAWTCLASSSPRRQRHLSGSPHACSGPRLLCYQEIWPAHRIQKYYFICITCIDCIISYCLRIIYLRTAPIQYIAYQFSSPSHTEVPEILRCHLDLAFLLQVRPLIFEGGAWQAP